MNASEIRGLILAILGDIAPEADTAALAGDVDMREALDLDSMDFLNFVTALHDRAGIDVPESDYPLLFTLDGAVRHLAK